MKISKIAKPIAVIGAAAVVLGASGCSDTTWSFKTDAKTLSNGEWIYYTYAAYNSALSKVEEENYDGKDIETRTIEGKTGAEWIQEEAKKTSLAHLTVEKLAAENKVEIDKSVVKMYKSQYSDYYKMAESLYTSLGVSEDSFADINATYPYVSNQLFEYLYGTDGPKAVSDDEIKKYVTENYTDYYYLSYSLTKTDDEGKTVSIDEETLDKVESKFADYAKMLNEGKTTADVETRYKTDFQLGEDDTVPSRSACEALDKNEGISDDLKKAITDLKEKTATVVKIDDTQYMIYRGDIKAKADSVGSEEADALSKSSVLYSMKNEEYKAYLEEEQKKLSYETNDACLSKYTVSRTVSIIQSESQK